MRLYIVLWLTLLASCGGAERLRTGDLLFQRTAAEGMGDAIAESTARDTAETFTHVGIVEEAADGTFVVEAIDTSVRRTPIADFLARSAQRDGRPVVAVGRLREAGPATVRRALQRAHERIGAPYDDDFLPDNGKFYCSELVWECYVAEDGKTPLLQSRPMNFRAADGQIPHFWVDHFAARDREVPQGVAGTNPNDMARDPAVEIVRRCYE